MNLSLQDKLVMEEEPPQVELLEEKLKLIESELTISVDRAQRAENEITELKKKSEFSSQLLKTS